MAPGRFKHLKLLVPDPYDRILSKLERGGGKDRDDADFLFRSQKLDVKALRERYEKELRHNLIGNVAWYDTIHCEHIRLSSGDERKNDGESA
jgi:hypothetical protein